MNQLEQERKRNRQEALKEYERIVSYDISSGMDEAGKSGKRKRRFRFRNFLFSLLILTTAACYFFVGKQLSDSNAVNKTLHKELSLNSERLNRLEAEWAAWKEAEETEAPEETEAAAPGKPETNFTAAYPLTGSCVILYTFGEYFENDRDMASCSGLILGTEPDTNVICAADGTVVYAGKDEETGLTVRIDHGNGYITHYCYNRELKVADGETVTEGQIIALPGSPDEQEVSLMEFRISYKGIFLDPEDLLEING